MSISSPDYYSVTSTDRAVTQVPADTLNSVKLVNQSGGTLYYKSDNTVSSSVNDGSLTAGQSVVLQATNFITTTTIVNVAVLPLTGIQDLGGISAANTVSTQAGTWQPIAATSGTDTACSNGTAYVGSIFLPNDKTLTGIQYLIGSVGGTDKVIVSLHDYSTGAVLANSATAGVTVGTAANSQAVPFTATYNANGPAHYWVAATFNGTTAKFRSVPAFCNAGTNVLGNGVTQTFGTPALFTPPTTFTADKCPVASVY